MSYRNSRPSHPGVAVAALSVVAILAAQPVLAAKKAETGQTLTQEFCQACHYFEGSDQAGTVGPPFVAMKARFPDRAGLRTLIYDPHVTRPHSMMPPFGRSGLVTDDQIERIVDYLYTL